MAETVGWGIIGTGRIAGVFATALQFLPDAKLVAVRSRTAERARAFADRFGASHAYTACEELASDPEVQAVYIATPHACHMEHSLAAIEGGKAVLCEKPFCINARQAREVVRAARRKRVFLMEAMWTRFLPVMVKLRELLAGGAIGEVHMVAAAFGFRAGFDPEQRLFNPELGGGALLDVGIYPVSLASMLFGPPDRIATLANLGETGVDEQSAMLLGHPKGQLAICYTAVRTSTPGDAAVMGSDGQVRIHAPWWGAKAMTLIRPGQEGEEFAFPEEGNGYQYEAAEVMRCLRQGLRESPTMPLNETISIMRTLDRIRAKWGLKYPME